MSKWRSLGPLEREEYLKYLMAEIQRLQLKILRIRQNGWAIRVGDEFSAAPRSPYMPDPTELLLDGTDHVLVLGDIELLMNELFDLLKTVNDISGQTLNHVRRRLLSELQETPHEKEESGPGPNRS
uniref:Uncharacterized protein n=1 Tax=Pseudomonas phage HRDY3 TaxID=3236930 RepID=A0AB39CDN4_9VIRU